MAIEQGIARETACSILIIIKNRDFQWCCHNCMICL
jgi:hypothetical protein